MQRVVSINLNGNAYQLDENAYNALFAYLDGAETQLKDNPDRAEIMADLEQAVAEKCSTYLGPHKTVITAAEVDRIIAQMGPVDAGSEHGAQGAKGTQETQGPQGTKAGPETGADNKARRDAQPARRLYQIREGSMISGVCNGLAAYFSIDVTLVRIIFVLLAIVTQGAWVLAYVVMMFVIPHASTPDERAAAHGMHFNAQEVIDQAKKNLRDFSKDFGRHDWMPHWRQRREWRRYNRSTMWNPAAPPPPGYAGPAWHGTMGPLYGIFSVALFAMLAFAVVSLFDSGVVFGWPFFPALPRWISVFVLIALFQLLVAPFRIARQAAYYHPYDGWYAMWHGFVWIGILMVFVWFAYHHIPEVHDFIRDLPFVWENNRFGV
jgi:phage shock protein PspC (stress-responsive transcriptional regulator)